MIGSAALTNRVDRLVARGLVTRDVIPGNRRSFHISLTAEGRELVDRTVEGHVQYQRKLLAGLGDGDAEELERILRALLVSLGDAR
jgi:DNA-binding MarR family transcriptional regulator